MGNRVAGTAIAIVALLAPAVADAGTPGPTASLGKSKGFQYFTGSYAAVVTQTGQPAMCKPGQSATGGGGSISGNAANSVLHETYPDTTGETGWVVEGSSPNSQTMRAYAICGPLAVSYETSQSPIDPGHAAAGGPNCPMGSSPVGGGAGATGPGLQPVLSSPRLPPSTPGWTVVLTHQGMDDTLFNTFAVCSTGYQLRYRSASARLKAGQSSRATAKCREEEVVIAGGFSSEKGGVSSYDSHLVTTRPWDSKDKRKTPDDGWQAESYNESATNLRVIAHAVCARGA